MPKKRYGQNYLRDKNILHKIVDLVPKDLPILEIGTGEGVLTEALAQHTDQPITSIEIDPDVKQIAANRLKKYPTITLILDDFLQTPLDLSNPSIVVANIPYYITSPIMERCLNHPCIIRSILMVQKELALRMVAEPGTSERSSFSIFCQTRAETKIQFYVSKNCFFPVPKVDSAVIDLHKTDLWLNQIAQLDIYNRIVKASFWGKRKTLMNCLQKSPYIKFTKTDLVQAFQKLNLSPTIRGQQCDLQVFTKLSNLLSEINDRTDRG